MIAFPDINPVIVAVGPLAISWYSLSYVTGILIGLNLSKRIVTKFSLNITHKNLEDFISWAIIGIIIGGRLGYVLLYDPVKFLTHPIDILKTYEGGMSFHGGITGIITAGYIFCKKYKLHFLKFTDILAIVAPIGLFLGRIANFINAELYGRITDVAWAVIFPNSDLRPRHPSQIYEALLEGLVLFIIILFSVFRYRTLSSSGKTSAIFLILYSIFRIIIENFREPDFQIGFILNYITMGQILSLPMLFLGCYLLIKR
ncbi:Prolipoprotein diacylglyceryl transferase [Candidatus Trichorickettsia mobilis]|uniref:Phosphatidylglycerol--prolipoprotein diacylglyceryl transferase n=1 Tax=Candidatus Trichorickettsia mobilis TaxID=1346319 RepID=A0ABZ0UQ91_9RICK|nr:Prolipoprotein diacylglyceryl transferase [Candidatus Trichorickettsia mobilis]